MATAAMESVGQSVAGLSAPYGQACIGCAKAKCKCVSRGNGTCERCHRRRIECRQSEGVRKRTARKPDISSRTLHLEDRLNDLVEILRSQQSNSGTVSKSHNGTSIPGNQTQAQATSDVQVSTASFPTPDTGMLSSGSQVASGSGTPSLDDDLSPFEAESILQRFRNEYLTMFPFVWIKPDTTASELKRYRPFLWLNIRTVCEKSAPRLHAYGNKVRALLAHKVLVELERDIDVLLGLMIYLGWATHQTRGRGFQARYANLANSLIQDLRLDQPFVVNANSSCWFPNSIPQRSPQTHEQRRAVIGTFVMCSSISHFLRIDVVRWNSHMEECLEKLAAEPEYFGDELLVAMARVKLIVEDIARVTWRCADYESSSPPWIYIKPLKDRLVQLQRSLTPKLAENQILLSHLQNAEVLIIEMVVFHPTTPVIMPQPTSFPSSIPIPEVNNPTVQSQTNTNSSLKPVDIPRLQALHDCLQAIKRNIDTVLSFEPVQFVGFPFALMCHMSHSMQTLYRLSVLEEPDWDRAAVRRDIDIIAVINKLADKMSKVAEAAGLTGDPSTPCGDMFTKGSMTLRATATIWSSSLPQIEDTTSTVSAVPAPFVETACGPLETAEISADAMAMMFDLNNDPWLTDLFTSWEGQ